MAAPPAQHADAAVVAQVAIAYNGREARRRLSTGVTRWRHASHELPGYRMPREQEPRSRLRVSSRAQDGGDVQLSRLARDKHEHRGRRHSLPIRSP
jgi:hypothetical protein